MQVSSTLQPTSVGAGRATSASAVRATSAAPAARIEVESTGSPRSGGLRGWLPDLNRSVSQAQQSREFLDGVTGHLQSLKAGLSASLAGRSAAGARVEETLSALGSDWADRTAASGGALDPQLRYTGPAAATRRFTVRGLDFPSLQQGDRETLALSVGPTGQRPLPVVVEPGLSERAIVQRLGQALSPAGVSVLRDEQGQLTLAVSEEQWPAVRDTLAVKGGGKRFPTGQFHRVRAEPEADAVPVASWKTETVDDRKATLQGVLTSLDRVRDAQSAVGRALASASAAVDASRPAQGAAWAAAAAEAFEAAGAEGGYATRAALVSAVDGLNRPRVQSVLRER